MRATSPPRRDWRSTARSRSSSASKRQVSTVTLHPHIPHMIPCATKHARLTSFHHLIRTLPHTLPHTLPLTLPLTHRRSLTYSYTHAPTLTQEEKRAPSKFAPAPDLAQEAYARLHQRELPREDGSRPSQRNTGKYDFTLLVSFRKCVFLPLQTTEQQMRCCAVMVGVVYE